MSEMNGQHSDADEQAAQKTREHNSRVFGWISGLALIVVPWMVAGFIATASTMVGPSDWSAERVFPWALLAGLAVGLVWVVFGSLRSRSFARGAIPGTAISLGLMGAVYVIGLITQG